MPIGAAAWIAIVGLGVSYEQGQVAASQAESQAEAQRRGIQAQERAANVKAQQERIKVAREARIARAQLLSGATTAGLTPSTSGVAGGMSSITSQQGTNIGAINVAQSFAEQASLANQQAATLSGDIAKTQATAAQWQAIGNTVNTIFKTTSGTPIEKAKTSRTMGTNEFMTYYKP